MNVTASFFHKNLFIAMVVLGTSFGGLKAHAFESLDPQIINELQSIEEPSATEFDPISGKKAKIIMAGDSWAMFPCLFGSMRKMLRDLDYPLVSDKRCFRTSRMGMRADQWLGSGPDRRLTRYLKNDSRIRYVYLSLGGNDMMKYWNTTFTPAAEEKLYKTTYDMIEKIINKYTKLRPDIKIILSGYDYGRLTEHNLISLYTTIYNRMLKPTPEQVNNQLIRFSDAVRRMANGKNIFYIHHLGLSHYYDGVPEQGLPCLMTMNPSEISTRTSPMSVGGKRKLPACTKSMINWMGLSRDAIHLSSKNYYYVMKHTYDNVLKYIINQPVSELVVLQN
jgi:lysophospholipase L1-like esterase